MEVSSLVNDNSNNKRIMGLECWVSKSRCLNESRIMQAWGGEDEASCQSWCRRDQEQQRI